MNVLEFLFGVTFLVGLPVLFVFQLRWYFRRAESYLKKWADQSGYHILDRTHRFFFRGPFFSTSTGGQAVYRVRVEDREGRQRQGWVRCGSWWLGLWSDRVDVLWDKPEDGRV
jgi:hypothetical protein